MLNTMTRLKLLTALCVALALVGCASGGADRMPQVSPEEQVGAVLTAITEALSAQDIDTMMSYYADDFESDQGQDKAATSEFLSSVKDQGFLEGIEIDTSAQTLAIDGDTATVEGVGLSGAFGVLTLGFKLEKRDDRWIVTYQSQQ